MNAQGTFRAGNKLGQRYPLNESTFDIIDTEIKAYCLGFLYADGSIGYYGGDYSIRIHIHKDDAEILDIFRRCVETTKPWYIDARDCALLALSNKRLYEGLVKHGVSQAKTFKITFPDESLVPAHLLHHFVRGYFDGDGSVTGREDCIRVMAFSVTSNMPFCIGLQDILIKEGFSRTKIGLVPSKVYPNKTVGVLTYQGGRNVERFYRYIYRDATVYLKRKHDRMRRLLDLRTTNNARPRHNKRSRIYLTNPEGQTVEVNMSKAMLASLPICKKSIYALAKGQVKQVRGWRLARVELVKRMVRRDLADVGL